MYDEHQSLNFKMLFHYNYINYMRIFIFNDKKLFFEKKAFKQLILRRRESKEHTLQDSLLVFQKLKCLKFK